VTGDTTTLSLELGGSESIDSLRIELYIDSLTVRLQDNEGVFCPGRRSRAREFSRCYSLGGVGVSPQPPGPTRALSPPQQREGERGRAWLK